MDAGSTFIFALTALAIYFIPTIIAVCRGSPYTGVIFALNLFGGWTGVCWLAAFVWSLWPKGHSAATIAMNHHHSGSIDIGGSGREARSYADGELETTKSQGSFIDELERLAHLRSIGAITLEEFQAQKAQLLGR
jgi:hypothetical protein